MDIKRFGSIEGIASGGVNPSSTKATKIEPGQPSFGEVLDQVGGAPSLGKAPGLKDLEGVKFSNHAVERMMSRGIQFSPNDVQRLNEAVGKAAAKGSKDSLILMNDSALIVSVKNKTVVTVMDKTALKENVFTNIDSTIVM